ncbi:MAG: integrase core domain-containing protein [Chloroflexota bacterium]
MDGQENVRLQDGDVATVASIRDPVGAAMIASIAYSTKTARRWRKLTIEELRHLFRSAFREWGTLPDRVVTDNEAGQVGNTTDPLFPSLFTLWLVGLGIQHHPIRPHRPTDQPHVERHHRTLADFTCAQEDVADLAALQQALDRERHLYNHAFPARASQCQGRPPLQAYPALLQPRRPYHPQLELTLFSLPRVLDYLAQMTFTRKVSAQGQVRVGRARYSVGSRYAAQAVQVRLDSHALQWVFRLAETAEEIARRPAAGLDLQTLTGLDPAPAEPGETPFQLALAFFTMPEGVRLFQDC